MAAVKESFVIFNVFQSNFQNLSNVWSMLNLNNIKGRFCDVAWLKHLWFRIKKNKKTHNVYILFKWCIVLCSPDETL